MPQYISPYVYTYIYIVVFVFPPQADHKGWCDTELSTNEQTRKEKTAAVETLHAEIDELEAFEHHSLDTKGMVAP